MRHTRRRNRIFSVIALFGAMTVFGFGSPAFAESLDTLKRQIEDLQRQVNDIEKKQASGGENKEAPVKGKGDGSFRLPGLNTDITIGGYIKLDVVHSDVSAGSDSDANLYFYPRAIPLSSAPSTGSNTSFTAKQSRLFIKSRTPTPFGDLKVHLEGDFYGEGGNQKVSNSSTWRLRHAYGELGNLLVGQTWSTFMNASALPETVDFGGPAAEIFIRQAQIRWTQPFEWGSVQVAAENPETWLIANDPTIATAPDDDNLPDLVGRVNFNTPVGALSLAVLGREYRIDSQGLDDSTYAGAVSLAGILPTFGKDDLRFTLNYGNALGRYMYTNFEGAQLDIATNEIKAVDQWGGFIAYRHFWTDTWRSTLSYSYGEADNFTDIVGDAVNKRFQSAHANVMWSPIPAVNFGLEYIWGYRELENGEDGELNRIQFGAQYKFF
jgi:hypothetical protein